MDASGPKHMLLKLSRAKLEQLVDDTLERTLDPCRQALKDAGKKPSDIDEVILVGGSTRIPKVQEIVKRFFGKEPHRGVNPDEVVAVGAAIQGGVLSGDVKDILLLDVTPLTLGIETLGGVRTALIKRNQTIPYSHTEIFSTAADNQQSVEIHVLQGEREMARDNRTLGKFHLEGIPPAPRGVPQIEVTFDIDANGILKVLAKDKATSKEKDVTITNSSGVDQSEIDRMVQDAEEHASADQERREAIESRNKLDTMVYQTDKMLSENKDKLQAADVGTLETALTSAREALASDDKSQIEAAIAALEQASHKLAEAMYQAASEGGDNPDSTEQAQDDGVVDAEVVED